METHDLEQVSKAIRGDREAYGRLVDAYQGMAFAVALNLTGNYNDSLDVIQDAFIQAYRKLSQLSDPSRFGSWLYTITRRVALRCLQERHKIPVGYMLLYQVEGLMTKAMSSGRSNRSLIAPPLRRPCRRVAGGDD